MGQLIVEVDDRRFEIGLDGSLTFGRDRACAVCLDPHDRGVSRVAGIIRGEGTGWAVTNLSSKRALHIVDAAGFAVPLPVALADGPPSRRAVDQHTLTVLITGEEWTYALILHAPPATAGQPLELGVLDPLSTHSQPLRLTDRRREVLVALARGYLRPYPHYDPNPLTYQEIADLLGLTRHQVKRRVEDVRTQLVNVGVLGLDRAPDIRPALCEWLLANRHIRPADLDWLRARITARRTAQPSRGAEVSKPA